MVDNQDNALHLLRKDGVSISLSTKFRLYFPDMERYGTRFDRYGSTWVRMVPELDYQRYRCDLRPGIQPLFSRANRSARGSLLLFLDPD